MTSVLDVAAYILEKKGEMTAWNLQEACLLLAGVVPGAGSAPAF